MPETAIHFQGEDCELFLNESRTAVICYVPDKAHCQARLEMETDNYVKAEVMARDMGLNPTWG